MCAAALMERRSILMKTTTHRATLITAVALVTLASLASLGCDKGTTSGDTTSKGGGPSAEGPKSTDNAAPKKNDPAPTPAGPSADRDKDYLGLVMKPFGDWATEWDADQHTAKWTREDSFSIMVRIENEKYDSVEDIKEEAPMMPQLGTAVTKVLDEKKTSAGFYAIVQREPDTKDLVYVRKFGSSNVICSANLKKDELNPTTITTAEAIEACGSLTLAK
jgi:hypothetical protein